MADAVAVTPVAPAAVDPRAIGFGALSRDGTRYSVPFLTPLFVRTPALEVATPLEVNGETQPHAMLHVPDDLARFFSSVEKAVLDACIERKQEWFGGRRMEDDELIAGFRSFVQPPAGIKVKVDLDVAVFDKEKTATDAADVEPGTRARAVLHLDKITFGRTEFGVLWRLVQLRKEPSVPACLINDSDDDDDDATGDIDDIVDGEFM